MPQRHAIVLVALLLAGAAEPPQNAADGDDTPPIVSHWQRLAEEGDGEAALQLGLIYDTGKDVPQDFEKAIHWYRQAADAGSAVAAFDLAALYDAGRTGTRDAAEALRWYRVAADRGFGRAAYVLGVMTEQGDGIAADPVEAARWYRQAMANGVTAARTRLAALRAAGRKPPDPSTAGPQAFANAVALWRSGGLDSGDPAALDALRAAAAGGYPLAQYDLGYVYEHGVGIEPQLPLAYAWYKLAAASDGSPTLKAIAAVNRDRLGRRLSDEERQAAEEASASLVRPRP